MVTNSPLIKHTRKKSMDLTQVLTGLESAKAEYDRQVQLAAAPLEDYLIQFCKANNLPGFIWTQYTPHFNDGDECIFGVNTPYLIVSNPEDVYGCRMYDNENVLELWWRWDKVSDEDRARLMDAGITKESYSAFYELARLLQSEELEYVLRTAFGDHVFVKVTQDAVLVDEYDHD